MRIWIWSVLAGVVVAAAGATVRAQDAKPEIPDLAEETETNISKDINGQSIENAGNLGARDTITIKVNGQSKIHWGYVRANKLVVELLDGQSSVTIDKMDVRESAVLSNHNGKSVFKVGACQPGVVTKSLSLTIDGQSKFDCGPWRVKTVTLKANGQSTVKVGALKTLRGDVDGQCRISYQNTKDDEGPNTGGLHLNGQSTCDKVVEK